MDVCLGASVEWLESQLRTEHAINQAIYREKVYHETIDNEEMIYLHAQLCECR